MSDPRIAFRQRGAFGACPIDPRMVPLALLRSSAAVKDPELLEAGVRELEQALATGQPTPMLPSTMLYTKARPDPDGGAPTADPRMTAAQVARAYQAAGTLAPATNVVTLHPANAEAVAAAREASARVLFAQPVSPAETIPAISPMTQAMPTHEPTTAEALDAYGRATAIAAEQHQVTRGGFIGRAMAEIAQQSAKILNRARGDVRRGV